MTLEQEDRLNTTESNTARMYRALCNAPGDGWVSLPDLVELHRVGYAAHSRAADLRRLGVPVENFTDASFKPRRSFYRLARNA